MEAKIKNSKKSIRTKIIKKYLFLFIISTFIFELFLIYSVKYYYYSTIEGQLRSEAKYSQELYLNYLTDYSLSQVILEDANQFYRQNSARVQILDNTGLVMLDNSGKLTTGTTINKSDVEESMFGREGTFIEKVDSGKIMYYSMPLKNRTSQVGIIRLSSSLNIIDSIIYKRTLIFVLFGFILVFMMIVLSILIANSIVKPINDLTKVAEKLAEGKFDVRSKNFSDDEIGELARTMNFITDNINEKEKIKNDFISSISHELRTPLTSIKGWAVTLQDLSTDEITKEGLDIIEKESDRLKDMVDELLDFSRFTSGRISLNLEFFNVTDIVKQVHKQLLPRAKNQKIDFILNYDNEGIRAYIDKNRFRQVLINLIDNSLKFTEAGGVVLINLSESEENIFLQVIDTGIGIDSEEISLITGKFYKGKNLTPTLV